MKDNKYKLILKNKRVFELPQYYKGINLRSARDYMLDSRQPEEAKLVSDLQNNFSSDIICQFIIPIYDRKLWENLCKRYKLTEKDRNYFVLDMFIPDLSVAIEADYSSTHENPDYDKARDEYCKKVFGISTIRVSNYGGVESTKLLDEEKLKKLLESLNSRVQYRFDFSKLF